MTVVFADIKATYGCSTMHTHTSKMFYLQNICITNYVKINFELTIKRKQMMTSLHHRIWNFSAGKW